MNRTERYFNIIKNAHKVAKRLIELNKTDEIWLCDGVKFKTWLLGENFVISLYSDNFPILFQSSLGNIDEDNSLSEKFKTFIDSLNLIQEHGMVRLGEILSLTDKNSVAFDINLDKVKTPKYYLFYFSIKFKYCEFRKCNHIKNKLIPMWSNVNADIPIDIIGLVSSFLDCKTNFYSDEFKKNIETNLNTFWLSEITS